MTVSSGLGSGTATSFRAKLLLAMMLVVSALTILGVYLAQKNVAATTQRDLKQSFEAELSWLNRVQQLRNAALQDRCQKLATKPRIHAALEDNALELLYPSAKDELRDLMEAEQQPAEQEAGSLHAKFYRFLNIDGTVLPPPLRSKPKCSGRAPRCASGGAPLSRTRSRSRRTPTGCCRWR